MRSGAVVGGLVAGVIGAALWAAIAKFFQVEIGYVAWGVGVLVGLGCLVGNGRMPSRANGVVAAGLTVVSIVAGKYAAIRMLVASEARAFESVVEASELAALRAEATQEGFVSSFGGLDLIFFGLAIVTAFRIAAGQGEDETDGDAPASSAPA